MLLFYFELDLIGDVLLAHCHSCGKEVEKPSRILKNYSFTIQAFNCEKCHHNFKVKINQSEYIV
jgi:hypothetical protein